MRNSELTDPTVSQTKLSQGIPGSPRLASARVAMIGAGQLARMTQQSALDLGVELRLLAADPADAAAVASSTAFVGAASSLEDLRAVAADCDAVTFDHERIPPDHLDRLEAEGLPLRPSAAAKLVAQDKLHARRLLSALGFLVPPFMPVPDISALAQAGERLGWPLVLKARHGGYDGRGVEVVPDISTAAAVLDGGGEWVAEQHVEIDRELAQIIVRSPDGSVVAYPLAETVQRDGICHEIHAPAAVGEEVHERAGELATAVADQIDAVGVIAVELFLSNGELIVNELALRPHNSGHFSIEGCETSQFENHLRAVLGWPLGRTTLRAEAVATLNVLAEPGRDPLLGVAQALAVPGAHIHLYGKESRPGRKVGHVTALAADRARAHATAEKARALLASGTDR